MNLKIYMLKINNKINNKVYFININNKIIKEKKRNININMIILYI